MRTYINGLVILFTIFMAGCGGGGPNITATTVTPTTLRYPGGNITLSATVTDNSAAVSSVWAIITNPDGTTAPNVTMTAGAGTYGATWAVPANTRTDGVSDTYKITVWAKDTQGNQTSKAATSVVVDAAGTPPAPPTL